MKKGNLPKKEWDKFNEGLKHVLSVDKKVVDKKIKDAKQNRKSTHTK